MTKSGVVTRAAAGRALLLAVALASTVARADAPPLVIDAGRIRRHPDVPPAFALAADARGFLWVGTQRGLLRFDGVEWQRVTPLGFGAVTAVAVDADGSVWLARRKELEGGVFRWDGATLATADTAQFERLRASRRAAAMPGVPRETLATTTWDDLTIVAAIGLLARRSPDEPLRALRLEGVPPELQPLSLVTDVRGDLWIGSRFDGVVQLRARPSVRTWQAPAPTGGARAVFSVLDDDGGVVACVGDGLARVRGGAITIEPFPRALGEWAGRSLARGRDGSLWIGTLEGGVLRGQEGRWRRYGPAEGVPGARGVAVHVDRRGRVLVALGDGGLVRLDGDGFVPIAGTKACAAPAMAFAESADGDLWWTTAGAGACRLRGDRVDRLTTANGLPEDDLRAVYVDRDGVVWIGGNHLGVALVRGDAVTRVPLDLGLDLEEVSSVTEDDAGHVWLGTPVGLYRLVRADVLRAVSGAARAVRTLHLGVPDGLLDGTVLAGYPPGAARTRDGSLWFPGLRGVVQVLRPAEVGNSSLPTPVIESLRLDGRPASPGAAVRLGGGNVEVGVVVPELDHPHRLRLSYRLDGFDEAWRSAGDARTIVYTSLPAGAYLLRVSVGSDDRFDRREATVAFTFRPPFHRTAPFLAACALLVVALALFAHRVRLWRLRDRLAAVTADRERIARDMHDSLEQELLAMKLEVDALAAAPAASGELRDRTARLGSLVLGSLDGARRAVWALRTSHLDRADLATRLGLVLGRALRGTTIASRVHASGPLVYLRPEAADDVVALVGEAITNARKHAAPRRIEVSVDERQGDVQVSVVDDGGGFDPAAAAGPDAGHFGLLGMRERAARLGGSVVVDSAPGRPTTVRLTIPARLRSRRPAA